MKERKAIAFTFLAWILAFAILASFVSAEENYSSLDKNMFSCSREIKGTGYHSADYNHDWKIDNTEYNRVLAYWRAGGYHPDPSGLDGFAAGFDANSQNSKCPTYHSADYNHDWKIDNTEYNRVLAYWRAGGYHPDPYGLDGFAAYDTGTEQGNINESNSKPEKKVVDMGVSLIGNEEMINAEGWATSEDKIFARGFLVSANWKSVYFSKVSYDEIDKIKKAYNTTEEVEKALEKISNEKFESKIEGELRLMGKPTQVFVLSADKYDSNSVEFNIYQNKEVYVGKLSLFKRQYSEMELWEGELTINDLNSSKTEDNLYTGKYKISLGAQLRKESIEMGDKNKLTVRNESKQNINSKQIFKEYNDSPNKNKEKILTGAEKGKSKNVFEKVAEWAGLKKKA